VGDCADYPHDRLVSVSTASQLGSAFANAQPGDLIELDAGTYSGNWTVTRSGTSAKPITICGPRAAVLNAGSLTGSVGLFLSGTDYWTLKGFTITNAWYGLGLADAHFVTVDSLHVYNIGEAAMVARNLSTHNRFQANYIHDTGRSRPEFGEGIYVGSAQVNWCLHSGCNPDKSDYNTITRNIIGPNIGSQMIDVKEGTTGTVITRNRYDGAGMSLSTLNNDAWVNAYGNGVKDSANVGFNGRLRDGYKVQTLVTGWGQSNSFQYDTLDGGNSSGYGYSVGSATNMVECSNVVSGFANGLSNLACTR
jgi:hypothetical protein